MAISNAGAAQIGIRITAEGVVETTNGIKLTNDEIRKLGQGLQQASNDGKAFTETQKQAQRAADDYINSLREQAATIGKTRLEIVGWRGDQLALTAAQQEAAKGYIRDIALQEQYASRLKQTREALGTVATAMGRASEPQQQVINNTLLDSLRDPPFD